MIPGMPDPRFDDPRGILAFTGILPEPYQLAEDATLAWDSQHRDRTRLATPVERVLLEHLGYRLPDDLRTVVRFTTASIRSRSWPQIDQPHT